MSEEGGCCAQLTFPRINKLWEQTRGDDLRDYVAPSREKSEWHFTENKMWNGADLPFFFFFPLLSARCPTAVCQIVPLKIEGISNLLRVESLLLHLLDVDAKINRAWNLLTTLLRFDLDYHRCGSVLSDFPIRLSNLYAKGYQFFFPHFPAVDKWTSLSVVSSYLSGEGLPGLSVCKNGAHWCRCMIHSRV